ncbi:MAG: tetratricopeptide repeat protein [Bacteroidales bacterium]|nr:tetratricopeptide repeat protein [Bacteroidales bacterium]
MKNLILIFGIFITVTAASQDYSKLQQAFKTSYEYENEGQYTKAIDAIKSVYDQESYEVNIRLGWLHYYAGLFTESVTYYQNCFNLKPYSIEARLGIVLPLAAVGNWKQVINHYNEILKIDSENYTANYRLGSIYYGSENFTLAYKYFEKLANQYPFDYDATHMYAWTNYKLGKFREAKVLFNKTLLIKSDDESATQGLELIK